MLRKEKNKLMQKIVKKLKNTPNLKAIVLYGSYARNEEHKGSDVDLLIVLDVEKPIKYLNEVIKKISTIDIDKKISPLLTNLEDENYPLYREILREGKVLYGKFDIGVLELKLEPYIVVSYALSSSNATTKQKIKRRVYGSKTIKKVGNKIYTSEINGLKDEKGCILISKSTLLLPYDKAKGFTELLDINKVKYRQFKVWKE